MTDTANLKLPFIDGSQAQKHITHNEALRILDAAIQIGVLDTDRTAPPLDPADGERHVVASGADGAWTGQEDAIATWEDGAWRFLAPKPGWCLWSAADDAMLVYDGAMWRALQGGASPLDNAPHLGVNTVADSSNLLSVRSNAALFAAIALDDDGTGDVRIQIAKEEATNTASVVFSDAFSGRAEFGLVGSNDFKLKISNDGETFTEAFVIDRETGSLTLPRGLALSGVVSPAQLIADQHNYDPAGLASASVLQIFSDVSRKLSGLARGAEGRIVGVLNVGSQSITLLDESTASLAANRFSLGSDLIIAAKQAALLRYDGTAMRWHALTRSGAAAAGALAAANNLSDLPSKAAARINLGLRDTLSANRTYYVRADGNDDNSGLTNTPEDALKTVQRAVDRACALDLGVYTVTIQVAAGVYTHGVTLKSYVGAGPIVIVGDETVPSNVLISTTGATCFAADGVNGEWHLRGMKLKTTTSGFGLVSSGGSKIKFQNLDFGDMAASTSASHMVAQGFGSIRNTGPYKISGNANIHWWVETGGLIAVTSHAVALSGTPRFNIFGRAFMQSIIQCNSSVFSGAATGKRYEVSVNSTIFVSGASENYLPGDVAGNADAASGGRYV